MLKKKHDQLEDAGEMRIKKNRQGDRGTRGGGGLEKAKSNIFGYTKAVPGDMQKGTSHSELRFLSFLGVDAFTRWQLQ